MPPRIMVSSLFSDAAREHMTNIFRSRGLEVVGPGPDGREPENLSFIVLPVTQPSLFRPFAINLLRRKITPVVVNLNERSNPPHIPGYLWCRSSDRDIIGARTFVLTQDGGPQYNQVREPDDHPLPVPKYRDDGTLTWCPTCFVQVRILSDFPLWLLEGTPSWGWQKPFVFLEGRNAAHHMTRLEKRGYQWISLPDGRRKRLFREGGPKPFLTGREIIERVPWEASFKMSVAGWPLRFVPIRYLFFLVSKGRLRRRLDDVNGMIRPKDASASGNDERYLRYLHNESTILTRPLMRWVWKKGHGPELVANMSSETVVHEGRYVIDERTMPSYPGVLRTAILRYLASPEGRERLGRAGLLHHERWGRVDSRGHWEVIWKERVPAEEDFEFSGFGGQGTWTGRNTEFLAPHYEQDPWDVFFSVEPKTALILKTVDPRQEDRNHELRTLSKFAVLVSEKPKGALLQQRHFRIANDHRTSIEEFSCQDVDRFGCWGSSPTALFIGTGRSNSLTRRILSAIAEGDIDPTPSDFRLGVRERGGDNDRGGKLFVADRWTAAVTEEPPFNWSPPDCPSTDVGTVTLLLRYSDELNGIYRTWDRVFRHCEFGILNKEDPTELITEELLYDLAEAFDHVLWLKRIFVSQLAWLWEGPTCHHWALETFEDAWKKAWNSLHGIFDSDPPELPELPMIESDPEPEEMKDPVREERVRKALEWTIRQAEKSIVLGDRRVPITDMSTGEVYV